MRIVHLPSSYLHDELGGTEVYVSTLVEALDTLGVENRVIVHGQKANGQPDPGELVRLPALPAVSRRQLHSRSTGGSPPGFQKFVDEWQPDLVHFHAFTLGAGIDHARLLMQVGVPYVITYHTPAQSCPRGTLMFHGREQCDGKVSSSRCSRCLMQAKGVPNWLGQIAARSPVPASIPDGPWMSYVALPSLIKNAYEIWLEFFRGAKEIVACAEFCKETLIANSIPKEKVRVLRQALPGPTRTRQLRLVRSPSRLRIGYFGRVTYVKGVDVAAKAIKLLASNGMEVDFQIVGPVRPDDQVWFESIQQSPNVKYLGILRGDQLQHWLRELDLVLIPSRWLETGPLTLLEAWDCETAVIGTRAGGIQDFMISANQLECLFENENVVELAETIKRFTQLSEPLPTVSIPGMTTLAEDYLQMYKATIDHSA